MIECLPPSTQAVQYCMTHSTNGRTRKTRNGNQMIVSSLDDRAPRATAVLRQGFAWAWSVEDGDRKNHPTFSEFEGELHYLGCRSRPRRLLRRLESDTSDKTRQNVITRSKFELPRNCPQSRGIRQTRLPKSHSPCAEVKNIINRHTHRAHILCYAAAGAGTNSSSSFASILGKIGVGLAKGVPGFNE